MAAQFLPGFKEQRLQNDIWWYDTNRVNIFIKSLKPISGGPNKFCPLAFVYLFILAVVRISPGICTLDPVPSRIESDRARFFIKSQGFNMS